MAAPAPIPGAGAPGGSAGGGGSVADAIKRLTKEAELVIRKPVPGVKFTPGGEKNPLEWMLTITGPAEYTVPSGKRKCPYAGVEFKVKVTYPPTYPFKNPDIMFEAGVLYHPNVNKDTGEVCADLIAKSFGPTKNTTDLAKFIVAFLETPNLETFVDGDAAHEITTAIAEYERKAARAAGKK